MTSPFYNFVNPFAIPQTAIPRRQAQPSEEEEESFLPPRQQQQQHPLQQFVLRPETTPLSSAPRYLYPASSIPQHQRPVVRRATLENPAVPRFSEDEPQIIFLKPQPKRSTVVHQQPPVSLHRPAAEARGRPQLIRILPIPQQPLAQARRLNPEEEEEEELEAPEVPPHGFAQAEEEEEFQVQGPHSHPTRHHTSMEDVDEEEEEEPVYAQQQDAPTPTTRFINNLIMEAAKQKQMKERGQIHHPPAAQRHHPALFDDVEPQTPSELEKQKLLEDLLFQSQPRRQRIVPQKNQHANEVLSEILAQALQQKEQQELESEEQTAEYPEMEPITPNSALENPQDEEEEEAPRGAEFGHQQPRISPQEQLIRMLQQAEAQKELERRQKEEQMRFIHPQRLQDQKLPTLQDLLQQQLKHAYEEQEHQEGEQQQHHRAQHPIRPKQQQQPIEEEEDVEMAPLFFQYPPRAHQHSTGHQKQAASDSEHPHANPFFNVYIPSEHNPLAKAKQSSAKQQPQHSTTQQRPTPGPQPKQEKQQPQQQAPSKTAAQQSSENDKVLKKIEAVTNIIEEHFFEVIQLSEEIAQKQFDLIDNASLQITPNELETLKRGVQKLDGLYTSQMIALDEIQSDDEEIRRKRKACVTKIQKILKSVDLLQRRVSHSIFQTRLAPETQPAEEAQQQPKQPEQQVIPEAAPEATPVETTADESPQATTIDISAGQELSSNTAPEAKKEQEPAATEPSNIDKQTA